MLFYIILIMDNLNYRGIIFDLDGTLVDTVDDLTDALNETLIKYGFNTVTREQMKRFIGNGLRRVIELSVPEPYKTDERFVEEALEDMKENYSKIWVNKTRAYPGIKEVLDFCQDNGIRLGVSSNKVDDATQYIVRTIFPDIDFRSIYGHREGVPHKPDPEQTGLVLAEMGLGPDEVLYVGDSEVDIATARNAGLDCLILDYGYGDYKEIKKTLDVSLIHEPAEIIEALKVRPKESI